MFIYLDYISSYTNQHFTDYEKNKWNFLLTSSSFFFEKSSFCFALFGIVWLQTQISSFFSILLSSFLFVLHISFIYFYFSCFYVRFVFFVSVLCCCCLFFISRKKKEEKKKKKRRRNAEDDGGATTPLTTSPWDNRSTTRRTKRRRRRKERVLHLNCEIICTVRFTVHMLWTTKCIHSHFRIHSHTNSYLILFIVQIDTHTKTYQKQIIY